MSKIFQHTINKFILQLCHYSILFQIVVNGQRTVNDTTHQDSKQRFCQYRLDPSQYYPCVLNYIGIHSWMLYRCPSQSTFDEQMQQCVNKRTVSDIFPFDNDPQFRRVANFVIATSSPNTYDKKISSHQFSLSSSATKRMESISVKKSDYSYENRKEKLKIDSMKRMSGINDNEVEQGVLWSNNYPIIKLSDTPVLEQKTYINARANGRNTYKSLPINENELKYKKVCYFTNWSQYRPGVAKFSPENIDPFLCTHIVYAFAYINNKTLLVTKVEENDEDLYRRVNQLKNQNPNLKTLLGVGGWNMKSEAFSAVVRNVEKRRAFIFDTINYLRKHNFDGFEADWEFPGSRGGNSNDKYYFTTFLHEFKQAAIAQSLVTGKPRLLLAAAVAAGREIVTTAYEVEKISKILDFINIMTYDFHGAWQNRTGLNAPLYQQANDFGEEALLNQDFGVALWLKQGAPAHKLVLGIPLFARTFLLARSNINDLRSPVIDNGAEGPFTRSAGFLSYFEICLLQTDNSWQIHSIVPGAESQYMFRGKEWVSFESLESVRKRAAYVVANSLGGMFVWSLDMDDFIGSFCHKGAYPYIKNSLSLLPSTMLSYL